MKLYKLIFEFHLMIILSLKRFIDNLEKSKLEKALSIFFIFFLLILFIPISFKRIYCYFIELYYIYVYFSLKCLFIYLWIIKIFINIYILICNLVMAIN